MNFTALARLGCNTTARKGRIREKVRFNKPQFNIQPYSRVGLGCTGLLLSLLFSGFSPLSAQPLLTNNSVNNKQSSCPEPALSRLVRHRVAAGETLESIAQQYNLLPTTLMGMNPVLQGGGAPVGAELLIPPFNGIRVSVPAGSSWRDIAKQYGVRADVLFEANGCQAAPSVVFVPGANWSPVPLPANTGSSPINRYPLPELASVVLAYGWQVNPRTNAVEFHSGVKLATPTETPVLAVGAGTVAFAGEQRGYGQLVVINHAQGLQTRYAQLQSIAVKVGQQVEAGTSVGRVGSASTPEAYLHFEVRSNSRLGWVAQDPGAYIQELRIGDPFRR